MTEKNKPKVKLELPSLCNAVKRVRDAYGDSQERFAQRIGIAVMTISRFERGVQIPGSESVLSKLALAANNVHLMEEFHLFRTAAVLARNGPSVSSISQSYSPQEWRLMHAARIAAKFYPDAALAIEKAAGPALALV